MNKSYILLNSADAQLPVAVECISFLAYGRSANKDSSNFKQTLIYPSSP